MVAGTEQAVLMVESEAKELPEDVMLGAVVFGHEKMQIVIKAINELAEEAGKDPWDWTPMQHDAALVERVSQLADSALQDAYRITQKQVRMTQVDAIRERVCSELITADMDTTQQNAVKDLFHEREAKARVRFGCAGRQQH